MTKEEFRNSVIPFSKKLYPMLFRILKNEDETRDALQELMLRLWNKRKELAKCSNQSAYIITMARNHCFDVLKKKRPVRLEDADAVRVQNLRSETENHDAREKFEHVRRIIDNLPEKYRVVIQMREIDGCTFDEIKAVTGDEVATIRVVLSRARKKIKEEVEKIYSYERKEELA